jgi:hypothetical protein
MMGWKAGPGVVGLLLALPLSAEGMLGVHKTQAKSLRLYGDDRQTSWLVSAAPLGGQVSVVAEDPGGNQYLKIAWPGGPDASRAMVPRGSYWVRKSALGLVSDCTLTRVQAVESDQRAATNGAGAFCEKPAQ